MSGNNLTRYLKDWKKLPPIQDLDVEHLMERTGATREIVVQAVKLIGNNNEKVERYLRNKPVL